VAAPPVGLASTGRVEAEFRPPVRAIGSPVGAASVSSSWATGRGCARGHTPRLPEGSRALLLRDLARTFPHARTPHGGPGLRLDQQADQADAAVTAMSKRPNQSVAQTDGGAAEALSASRLSPSEPKSAERPRSSRSRAVAGSATCSERRSPRSERRQLAVGQHAYTKPTPIASETQMHSKCYPTRRLLYGAGERPTETEARATVPA
jgi:hypothetical protein